jgi:hypothetical protein
LAGELATENEPYFTNCLVDGVVVNVWLKKTGKDDYLFLIGTMKQVGHLGQTYRYR